MTQEPRPTKFRKRPLVIEAFQMTKANRLNNEHWPEWLNRAWNFERYENGAVYPTIPGTGDGTLSINTLDGIMDVQFDNWIIRGTAGELYPCDKDIFEEIYEAVDGNDQQVTRRLTPEQVERARSILNMGTGQSWSLRCRDAFKLLWEVVGDSTETNVQNKDT